jgi:hypothetical protein
MMPWSADWESGEFHGNLHYIALDAKEFSDYPNIEIRGSDLRPRDTTGIAQRHW